MTDSHDTSWRYPPVESVTVHPDDRDHLNRQLPTATAFGQPLPGDLPIIESRDIPLGELRVRIEGQDITAPLGCQPISPCAFQPPCPECQRRAADAERRLVGDWQTADESGAS